VGRQTASRSKKKPTEKAAGKLELLSQVPSDGASLAEWDRRFNALPIKEKNRVIRENAEVLTDLYGDRVRNGELLIAPLAAESNGDRDEGEFAFLVSVRPLRERLIAEYGITTAAEFMLLDALVLSYFQYVRAATTFHSYTAFGKSFNYETLVRHAQAYMIRANEMFLRNLEALRRLKAAPFTIKIEQAGQVNVGEKQLNLAAGSADGGTGQPSGHQGAPEEAKRLPGSKIEPVSAGEHGDAD